MDREMDVNTVLDYAVFQKSSSQNRYEALVFSKGKTEKIASGPLDQLALNLPETKGFQSNSSTNGIKLQLPESLKGSSWFTKFTLARFLHVVNSAEVLKSANTIENEMSQLEDTRRFHLALYAKEHPDHSGGAVTGGCLNEVGLSPKIKAEKTSSDATKNELLRALDLRLTTLKEELVASLNRAAGANLSSKEISDLVAFSQHFGATHLRNSFSKYLELCRKDHLTQPSVEQPACLDDTSNNCEDKTVAISQPSHEIGIAKPLSSGVSPVKIAQAERQSLTESEGSSDSSDEDRTFVERSRPVVRSASPRRSASPMRRIQIGRSGSRRSNALSIKSLNYFPARERIFSNRDASGNNSGDEEPDQPTKKVENTVRRMSVQDAINLFESKQKGQNVDVQKRRASVEVSASTSKTVLRRWSAGMGDSFVHRSEENTSEETGCQNTSISPDHVEEEKKSTEVKTESEFPASSLNLTEISQDGAPSEEEKAKSPPMNNSVEFVIPQDVEINDRGTASAEWSRQKEAELNQMLMKMMESKPGKYQGRNVGGGGRQDTASEQREDFYSPYKEKRDEKPRAVNAGKRVPKEDQKKVMQETLGQNKMASKTKGLSGKNDSSNNSQRPRRNSSPPVLGKKEVSKPAGMRKASLKSSPLPTTRSSWSSGPLLKTNGTQQTKISPRTTANNATLVRRKPQSTPPQTQQSPRTERPMQQLKGKKGTPTEVKPAMKGQEEKKHKAVTRTSKSAKTNGLSAASGDDSSALSTKTSFYNKVAKKSSSVVPLESKPFLRKGTGIGSGVGQVIAKSKVTQSEDSSKKSGNLTQAEERDYTPASVESTTKVLEVDLPQPANDIDANLEISLDNDLNLEKTENPDRSEAAVHNGVENSVDPPAGEIQPDEEPTISSAAWVEEERQEISVSHDDDLSKNEASPGLAPPASSSPRVHHSLSQMLLADSNEPEVIEWGNAENPPALVYQKDAPKGFKRLLKFGRKNKGEANLTGWASPSLFSEGEDDPEESKAASKRNLDPLSRKAALKSKGYNQQKNVLSESFDTGSGRHDSAQSSTSSLTSLCSDKLRGHVSATTASTKTTRSFFSFSTFRSSKPSETKHR